MTRLLQAGFELGDSAVIGSDGVGASGGAVSMATGTPTPRSGTYCLKCTVGTPANGTTWTAWLGKKTFAHASKTELWYAFGLYAVHGVEQAAGSSLVFVAYDTSGNANVLITLDSGTLRAYYATAGAGTPSFAQCTLIAAASSAMSMNAWHLIEIRIVAATGGTGNFELYLDGSSVISTSSQRTAQANANLGSFALMCGALQTIVTIGASTYHAFDDVRMQDTSGPPNNGRPGDEKIVLMTPNAAGDSTQWTPSAGSNYQCVDDIPPNAATDYVSDTTVGHLDLYNLPSVTVATVSAVNVIVQAMNPDGGGGSINLPTKTGAGQSDGSAQNITSAWAYFNRLLETDPADSNAWDQTKINALQIGVKVAS